MKVNILGVLVDAVTYKNATDKILEFTKTPGSHYVVTPYAESIVSAYRDEEYKRVINEAHLVVPDGVGILMAAKFLDEAEKIKSKYYALSLAKLVLLGISVGIAPLLNPRYFDVIKERVSGVDLVMRLSEIAGDKGLKVYFLGGWGNTYKEVIKNLRQIKSGFVAEGASGFADISRQNSVENEEIVSSINNFAPDFLFVSYRPVYQEKWISRNLNRLNSRVIIGVAGAFDMISGRKLRAPAIFQKIGLEWFWRLLIEPKRFFRIINAIFVFPVLVFIQGVRLISK